MVPGAALRPSVAPLIAADHLDRLVALEHERDQRAAGDEVAQRRVEVLLDVLGVVLVGQGGVDVRMLHRDDASGPWPRTAPGSRPTSPRRTASGLSRTRVRWVMVGSLWPSPGCPSRSSDGRPVAVDRAAQPDAVTQRARKIDPEREHRPSPGTRASNAATWIAQPSA